jgi:hypothetical protein
MPYGHPDDPAAAEAKVMAELSGVSPDDKDKDKGAAGELLKDKSNPNDPPPLNITHNATGPDLSVQHLPELSREESAAGMASLLEGAGVTEEEMKLVAGAVTPQEHDFAVENLKALKADTAFCNAVLNGNAAANRILKRAMLNVWLPVQEAKK